MVFRLPSHLESFIPAPSAQRPQPPGPWRGRILIAGMQTSDRSSSQDISVTAVETDGEKVEHWPAQFFARMTHDRAILGQVQEWVRHYAPPICTFMPDRLRDADANTVNVAKFRSLSRLLFDNQIVAIAPWGADSAFTGAGIIIYPAQNTSAMLVGALFCYMPFPDFVLNGPSIPSIPMPHSMMQPHHSRHPHYQQQTMIASSSYASPTHHSHTHSSSPHRSNPNSPIEQPIAGHRQDPYRYIRPYPTHGAGPSSADPSTWPVKAEDDTGYATFSPTQQNPPFR